VVAINSDSSIHRLKGTSRPVHSDLFRGAVLAQLPYVDFVTVFNEDTPLNLLEDIKPCYHVKGGSFINDRIRAEQELLCKWNGELKSISMQGDYSTSRILELYSPESFPI